jgi:hypothetical protein
MSLGSPQNKPVLRGRNTRELLSVKRHDSWLLRVMTVEANAPETRSLAIP